MIELIKHDNKLLSVIIRLNYNSEGIEFLAYSSHGFEMLEDSKNIEVKKSSYVGEIDKVRFKPVSKSQVEIR